MTHKTILLTCSALLASAASAHHSFAPHFDADKPVSIVGVITEFEQRNPHAYLHVRAEDADGRMVEWRCESHGVTQLTRNGLGADMFAVGTSIRIDGSQHRRDPRECFFDTVHLADGRVLSVNGPTGQVAAQPALPQRDSIFGTWLMAATNRGPTSGPQFLMDFMTDA